MKRKRNICEVKRIRKNMDSSGRQNLKKMEIKNTKNRVDVQIY
jgi:hypothetical protein